MTHNPRNHRYSASSIYSSTAITDWYRRRYNVEIDPRQRPWPPSAQGASPAPLMIIGPGDVVFVPNPTYPYALFGRHRRRGLQGAYLSSRVDFFDRLRRPLSRHGPENKKMLIINYCPSPTTLVVEGSSSSRSAWTSRRERPLVVRLAYADIVFDSYKAPSFLECREAEDSKAWSSLPFQELTCAGWRVGFAVGNRKLVGALTRIKSYLDYGMFQPIQIAGIIALNGPQDCVAEWPTRMNRGTPSPESFRKAGWEIESRRPACSSGQKIPDRSAP
ncbi:MAG: aminotransferase class I/II-fold pyridoxal phosphate-dependent enzyme [Deltaproteobacteria bacterium]|nr:aminotransferase class I/II-fold pyridoxal phosphate-dependent enzyme [Deltaproteobacteria bacterium]